MDEPFGPIPCCLRFVLEVMSMCENLHMHWEREGRWHQAWIQIRKMCMKEQKKTQNLILQHRKVWCSFSAFLQMGFSAPNGKHHFLSQIICLSGYLGCMRSHLAGRLKPICRMGAVLVLSCCFGSVIQTMAVISWAFTGAGENRGRCCCIIQERKTSELCKWFWYSSKHLLSDIISYILVSLLGSVSCKPCTLQGHLHPKRNLQN